MELSAAERLRQLKMKARSNSNNLYKLTKPEVLRQQNFQLKRKPWLQRKRDLTDYFNYGFNDFTFQVYAEKVSKLSEKNVGSIQTTYKETSENFKKPWQSIFQNADQFKDTIPIDYGGVFLPVDEKVLPNQPEKWPSVQALNELLVQQNTYFEIQGSAELQYDYLGSSDQILYNNKLLTVILEQYKTQLMDKNEEDQIYFFGEVAKYLFKKQQQEENDQQTVQRSLDEFMKQMNQTLPYCSPSHSNNQRMSLPLQEMTNNNDSNSERKKEKKKDKKVKKIKKDKKKKHKKKHKKHKHRKDGDQSDAPAEVTSRLDSPKSRLDVEEEDMQIEKSNTEHKSLSSKLSEERKLSEVPKEIIEEQMKPEEDQAESKLKRQAGGSWTRNLIHGILTSNRGGRESRSKR